jgi:hypothetical protein
MIKKYTLTFNTWGEKLLSRYEYRIKNLRLTWCTQLFKIINIKTLFKKKNYYLLIWGVIAFNCTKKLNIEKLTS